MKQQSKPLQSGITQLGPSEVQRGRTRRVLYNTSATAIAAEQAATRRRIIK